MAQRTPSETGPRQAELLAAGVGLAQEAVAAETTQALTAAGVRSIVLKGPAVIRWIYPERTDRFSEDVDILVSPGDLRQAEAVLARLGYEPFEPRRDDRHARSWTRASDERNVDLHSTLSGAATPDEHVWTELWNATELLEVGGVPVHVLKPHARALHLALHAAQEVLDKTKALRDLARGLELLPLATWGDATALARELQAEPAFAAGLRLLPQGQTLADTLDLTDEVPPEIALRLSNAPDMSLTLNKVLDLEGRERVRYAVRRAFPSPAAIRVWLPLARRGPAGLAAAYAWRAVWLVTRLGPAVRAVRAARTKGPRADEE